MRVLVIFEGMKRTQQKLCENAKQKIPIKNAKRKKWKMIIKGK